MDRRRTVISYAWIGLDRCNHLDPISIDADVRCMIARWGSLSSRAPGPQSSAPQPAPSPAQPVPIRPGGAGTGRSMADLFKQSAANSNSAANHQPPPPPPSYAKPVEANGEVNGWGQLESGQNTDPVR